MNTERFLSLKHYQVEITFHSCLFFFQMVFCISVACEPLPRNGGDLSQGFSGEEYGEVGKVVGLGGLEARKPMPFGGGMQGGMLGSTGARRRRGWFACCMKGGGADLE